MSYCRWSSDNFKSDVYAYESGDNEYTIHVASSRIVGEPPIIDYSSSERVVESSKARRAFMKSAKYVPIGLPHDGDMFIEPDLHSFRARLVSLRDMGYHVPSRAFDSIDSEIAELLLETCDD